jgi:hypothetical protein
MTENPALSALTDHFYRFLEAVKEACGLQRRRGLLAGPMALLMWIQARRMRKEAAAMMEQAFRALIEQFAVLLEEYRAGKLNAQNATQVEDPLRKAKLPATGPIEDSAFLRDSAPSAVVIPNHGERREPHRPRVRPKERAAKGAQPPPSRTSSVYLAARPPRGGERRSTAVNWRPLTGAENRMSRILDGLKRGCYCAHLVPYP